MQSASPPRTYVGVNVAAESLYQQGIVDMMRRHAAHVIDEVMPRVQESAANMANEPWRRNGKRRGQGRCSP